MSERGTVDDDTQEFDPFPFPEGEDDDRGEDGNTTVGEEGRREEKQREKVRRGIDS